MAALDGLAKGHAVIIAAADPAALRRPRAPAPRALGPPPTEEDDGEEEEEEEEEEGRGGGQALRMLEELLAVG